MTKAYLLMAAGFAPVLFLLAANALLA